MTVAFRKEGGYHRLEPLDSRIGGCYFRFVADDRVVIPTIWTIDDGRGHLSAFLNDLPTDETIEFAGVVNPILEGALLRRGFLFVENEPMSMVRKRS